MAAPSIANYHNMFVDQRAGILNVYLYLFSFYVPQFKNSQGNTRIAMLLFLSS